jgi:hypothetical protein
MRHGVVASVVCAMIACKQPPSAPAGSGSGSAVTATGSGSAAPAAGLAFDQAAADDAPEATAVAFAGKVPRLPAVSADGSQLAVYGYPGSGPMMPAPINLEIHEVNSDVIRETLPLLEENEAIAASEHAGSDWRTPALRKTLAGRGATVLARLRGFRSLAPVAMDHESSGEDKLTRFGDLVLDPGGGEAGAVELRDARGGVLQRAELAAYSTRSRSRCSRCSTRRPMARGAWSTSTSRREQRAGHRLRAVGRT